MLERKQNHKLFMRNYMKIYIDAGACPAMRIAERVTKEHGIPVLPLCDTNHAL